jgi:hypothetical protein
VVGVEVDGLVRRQRPHAGTPADTGLRRHQIPGSVVERRRAEMRIGIQSRQDFRSGVRIVEAQRSRAVVADDLRARLGVPAHLFP